MLDLRLLLLPLPFLLLGVMAAVETPGGGAEHTVMAGIMPGNAANHGAFQATLGLDGRRCSQREG